MLIRKFDIFLGLSIIADRSCEIFTVSFVIGVFAWVRSLAFTGERVLMVAPPLRLFFSLGYSLSTAVSCLLCLEYLLLLELLYHVLRCYLSKISRNPLGCLDKQVLVVAGYFDQHLVPILYWHVGVIGEDPVPPH